MCMLQGSTRDLGSNYKQNLRFSFSSSHLSGIPPLTFQWLWLSQTLSSSSLGQKDCGFAVRVFDVLHLKRISVSLHLSCTPNQIDPGKAAAVSVAVKTFLGRRGPLGEAGSWYKGTFLYFWMWCQACRCRLLCMALGYSRGWAVLVLCSRSHRRGLHTEISWVRGGPPLPALGIQEGLLRRWYLNWALKTESPGHPTCGTLSLAILRGRRGLAGTQGVRGIMSASVWSSRSGGGVREVLTPPSGSAGRPWARPFSSVLVVRIPV